MNFVYAQLIRIGDNDGQENFFPLLWLTGGQNSAVDVVVAYFPLAEGGEKDSIIESWVLFERQCSGSNQACGQSDSSALRSFSFDLCEEIRNVKMVGPRCRAVKALASAQKMKDKEAIFR